MIGIHLWGFGTKWNIIRHISISFTIIIIWIHMCGLKYRNYHIYTLKTCMLCIASYNAHISMRDLHYPSPLIRLPTCLLDGQTFSASLCFGVCNDNFQIIFLACYRESWNNSDTYTRSYIRQILDGSKSNLQFTGWSWVQYHFSKSKNRVC